MKIHSVNNNIYQTSAVKNSKRSFGRLIGEHEFIDYVQRKSNLPYMSVKYLTETIDEVKDELNNPKLDKFVANFSIEENLPKEKGGLVGNKLYFNTEDYNVYPVVKKSLDITPYLIDIANDKMSYKAKMSMVKSILSFFNKVTADYNKKIERSTDNYPTQSLADFLADYNKSYL